MNGQPLVALIVVLLLIQETTRWDIECRKCGRVYYDRTFFEMLFMWCNHKLRK